MSIPFFKIMSAILICHLDITTTGIIYTKLNFYSPRAQSDFISNGVYNHLKMKEKNKAIFITITPFWHVFLMVKNNLGAQ